MFDQVEKVHKELAQALVKNASELEAFRIKFIGKKSVISGLFDTFKTVPNDQKKAFGEALNELKKEANTKFQSLVPKKIAHRSITYFCFLGNGVLFYFKKLS